MIKQSESCINLAKLIPFYCYFISFAQAEQRKLCFTERTFARQTLNLVPRLVEQGC